MTPDINALLRDLVDYLHTDEAAAEHMGLKIVARKRRELREQVKAFLAADMVAVPREPTDAMISAAKNIDRQGARPLAYITIYRAYKAMIAAAEGE